MRHAVLSDGDELPIDHGVAFDAFEGLGDLGVGATDDLSVAAVERDAPVPISATIRKPSYLSSKTQSGSSKAPSVRVASIGCKRLGSVDLRLISGQSADRRAERRAGPGDVPKLEHPPSAAVLSVGRPKVLLICT